MKSIVDLWLSICTCMCTDVHLSGKKKRALISTHTHNGKKERKKAERKEGRKVGCQAGWPSLRNSEVIDVYEGRI